MPNVFGAGLLGVVAVLLAVSAVPRAPAPRFTVMQSGDVTILHDELLHLAVTDRAVPAWDNDGHAMERCYLSYGGGLTPILCTHDLEQRRTELQRLQREFNMLNRPKNGHAGPGVVK